MAAINPTSTHVPRYGTVHKWASVTESDTFNAVELSSPDAPISVQVYGTIGGATVTITGSLAGTTYATLSDTTGAACTFTAAGIKGVLQSPLRFIQPSHTGGSSESVTVEIFEGAPQR